MPMVGYLGIPGVIRGATAVTQYRAVIKDSTARQILPVTNANASKPLGILQDDPAATGEPCDVAYMGVCKAECGGVVTAWDDLALDNSGRVIQDDEVADGGAVDLHHVAVALDAGSGAGSIIDVLLHAPQRIGSE